jgi:hypothetical protein
MKANHLPPLGIPALVWLLASLLIGPAAGVAGTTDAMTPQAGRRSFLPLAMRPAGPTPTPTATPNRTLSPTCYWFELGPSDRDNVACSPTQGLVIQRFNISHSMVACCGTAGAKHYAISVDAAKTAGDGDYRIGFDVRSLTQGGGYLFGVNPDTRSYSLRLPLI